MDKTILELKKSLKQKNINGIALDIDETIAWTAGHWMEKLQNLFGNPENLTPKEMVTKYRYTYHVPYWQTDEIKQWMKEAIVSNEAIKDAALIENSNQIVNKINRIIPVVCYVTVRPQVVFEGTKKWLEKHAFPKAPIIMRPDKIEFINGYKWKAETICALYPELIGIIDDNPKLPDNLPNSYKGTIYLYDNISHPRTDLHIIPCRTWNDVYEKIVTFNT
jgi:hypothetical protein